MKNTPSSPTQLVHQVLRLQMAIEIIKNNEFNEKYNN
jgi:hypothetical protein